MAAIHGSISEFCLEKENWTSVHRTVPPLFHCNDVIAEEKKRAILLSTCGGNFQAGENTSEQCGN